MKNKVSHYVSEGVNSCNELICFSGNRSTFKHVVEEVFFAGYGGLILTKYHIAHINKYLRNTQIEFCIYSDFEKKWAIECENKKYVDLIKNRFKTSKMVDIEEII